MKYLKLFLKESKSRVVITLIIYYICYALDFGIFSIIIALIVSIASAWGSYYYSDKIVLSINRARPATEEENKKLINILLYM